MLELGGTWCCAHPTLNSVSTAGSPFARSAASLAHVHRRVLGRRHRGHRVCGSWAAREETPGPCECCAHPDSHPVRGDVAGPGGGSEEAYFGWGLRGTFPGLQLIPGETVPTAMEMNSENSKVLNCLFTLKYRKNYILLRSCSHLGRVENVSQSLLILFMIFALQYFLFCSYVFVNADREPLNSFQDPLRGPGCLLKFLVSAGLAPSLGMPGGDGPMPSPSGCPWDPLQPSGVLDPAGHVQVVKKVSPPWQYIKSYYST